MYEFPTKKFYWAVSTDFQFREMPDLNDQYKSVIDREASLFEGKPDKKIVSVKKDDGKILVI